MTNVKYLKENNLYDAHKHFMRLAESYLPLEEDLEEANDEDPNAMGGDPNAMGGGNPNAMGGDPNAMGGDPNAMGGADPNAMGGDPNAMGEDPNAMGGDPNAMGGADPNAIGGDDPTAIGDEMPPMDDPMEGESQEEGDTIDVGGMTHAADKTYQKQNQLGRDLAKVDTRMSNLIDMVAKLQSALDSNNSEIESLKSEFEKRNPTQTEKLNLRSLDSYPFNVKPTDYWNEKAKQGGYEAYADNEEPTSKEYVITNDDVDDVSDDVANTFFQIDDDDIQTLDKLFRL